MNNLASPEILALSDLPIGSSAIITEISNAMRNPKKFADAGMVPGTRLSMESHAPLGGLLRIKLLGSSLALHRNDGKNIMVKLS